MTFASKVKLGQLWLYHKQVVCVRVDREPDQYWFRVVESWDPVFRLGCTYRWLGNESGELLSEEYPYDGPKHDTRR